MKSFQMLLPAGLVFISLCSAKSDWKAGIGDAWDGTVNAVTSLVSMGEAPPPTDEEFLRERWPALLKDLDKGLVIVRDRELLPEKKGMFDFFGDDKGSKTEELEQVFAQIQELFSGARLSWFRDRIDHVSGKRTELESKLLAMEESRFGMTGSELAKHEKAMESIRSGMAELAGQEQELRNALAAELSSYGLEVSPEQLEVLLVRVDRDDVLALVTTVHLTRQIVENLSALLKQSGENIATARRYYGMFLVMLELNVLAHRTALEKLDVEYIPSVEQVNRQAQDLIEEARRLTKAEASAERKAAYEQNIRSNEITLKAARAYRTILASRRAGMEESLDRLRADYDLAFNTFRTVSISADFLRVVSASMAEFAALMELGAPVLVPFENLEVERAFSSITEHLKRE